MTLTRPCSNIQGQLVIGQTCFVRSITIEESLLCPNFTLGTGMYNRVVAWAQYYKNNILTQKPTAETVDNFCLFLRNLTNLSGNLKKL